MATSATRAARVSGARAVGWLAGAGCASCSCVLLLARVLRRLSWQLAQVDPGKLADRAAEDGGAGRRKAWPPATDELPVLLLRTAETVAMAAIGTTVAAAARAAALRPRRRNVTPSLALYYPARWFLNALRGIDSFVFALLFVAAVGLGPFAGVLGIALHTWGSTAKLWAEAIENIPPGPLEAAAATGASRLKVVAYALLPDVAAEHGLDRRSSGGSSTCAPPPCSASSARAASARS